MTLPIKNDHLPANHQDIDNIPTESDQEFGPGEVIPVDDPLEHEVKGGAVIGDIVDLEVLSLDELGELYDNALHKKEDVDAEIVEIKKTIYDKQKVDSQRAGRYLSIKGNKKSFPELTIEKARDLGLTKVEEKLDTKLVNKAHENGVDLGKVELTTFHTMRFVKESLDEDN